MYLWLPYTVLNWIIGIIVIIVIIINQFGFALLKPKNVSCKSNLI